MASYACNPHQGWRMQAPWTNFMFHPNMHKFKFKKAAVIVCALFNANICMLITFSHSQQNLNKNEKKLWQNSRLRIDKQV